MYFCYFYYVCMCVCMWIYVWGTCRSQRHWMPLEVKLKAFVGHPAWLLGTKLHSYGRAESALKIFVIIFLSFVTSMSYRSYFPPTM